MKQARVRQFYRTDKDKPSWCTDMWYAYVTNYATGETVYLRNDGCEYPKMQRYTLDADGGTYFPTEKDAQKVADNYNATQNEINKSDTETTTDETSNPKKQKPE